MPHHVLVAAGPDVTGSLPRVRRWFYINVGVTLILLNAVAFAPGMFDQSRRNVPLPLTPLVAAHAALSAAWLGLFLVQAALVATRRVALHRRTGIAGAALAVAFVGVGCLTVAEQARRGFDLSGDIGRLAPPGAAPDPAATLGIVFFFLNVAALVGAAILYRRRPAVHKRLMLLAMIGGMTPTPLAHLIGHWPVLQQQAGLLGLAATLIVLCTSAIYDRVSEGRIHPVSLYVPVLLVSWQVVVNTVIVRSSAWQRLAAWVLG